jgi:hypothetical protein
VRVELVQRVQILHHAVREQAAERAGDAVDDVWRATLGSRRQRGGVDLGVGRDHHDARRTERDGGGQRHVQAHPSVNVVGAVDLDRTEQDRIAEEARTCLKVIVVGR